MDINQNPFVILHVQLTRMEAMIFDLKQKVEQLELNKKNVHENGLPLAMEITGYKKSTIYNLINQRLMPHSKRRGKLIFDRKTLENWWITEGNRMMVNEPNR